MLYINFFWFFCLFFKQKVTETSWQISFCFADFVDLQQDNFGDLLRRKRRQNLPSEQQLPAARTGHWLVWPTGVCSSSRNLLGS